MEQTTMVMICSPPNKRPIIVTLEMATRCAGRMADELIKDHGRELLGPEGPGLRPF